MSAKCLLLRYMLSELGKQPEATPGNTYLSDCRLPFFSPHCSHGEFWEVVYKYFKILLPRYMHAQRPAARTI